MPVVSPSRSGGGLPSQWTTDGHGNVVATADQVAAGSAGVLRVEAVNQPVDGTDVFQLLTKTGAPYVSFDDSGFVEIQTDRTQHTSTLKLEGTDNSFGTFLIEGSAWDAGAGSYVTTFVVLNSGIMLTHGGVATQAITSGALPTVAPVSGTAFQCSTTRDVFLVVRVTYNPTAGAAATCLVQVSPDNVTFSTVGTETEPAGVAFDGTIHLLTLQVPAAWWVKLTVVNATLGTGTYY